GQVGDVWATPTPGRADHVSGLQGFPVGAHTQDVTCPFHGPHPYRAAHGQGIAFLVGGQVAGHVLCGGVLPARFLRHPPAGKHAVVGRCEQLQGVPVVGPGATGPFVVVHDDVVELGPAQVVARRQSGLSATDHHDVERVPRDVCPPFPAPVGPRSLVATRGLPHNTCTIPGPSVCSPV